MNKYPICPECGHYKIPKEVYNPKDRVKLRNPAEDSKPEFIRLFTWCDDDLNTQCPVCGKEFNW